MKSIFIFFLLIQLSLFLGGAQGKENPKNKKAALKAPAGKIHNPDLYKIKYQETYSSGDLKKRYNNSLLYKRGIFASKSKEVFPVLTKVKGSLKKENTRKKTKKAAK